MDRRIMIDIKTYLTAEAKIDASVKERRTGRDNGEYVKRILIKHINDGLDKMQISFKEYEKEIKTIILTDRERNTVARISTHFRDLAKEKKKSIRLASFLEQKKRNFGEDDVDTLIELQLDSDDSADESPEHEISDIFDSSVTDNLEEEKTVDATLHYKVLRLREVEIRDINVVSVGGEFYTLQPL